MQDLAKSFQSLQTRVSLQLHNRKVSSRSSSHSIMTDIQEYWSALNVMMLSTDMAIQHILLYWCLCWVMNFFVSFSTDGIFSGFRSPHNCTNFHTCKPDFFLTRNWKVLKTWHLDLIGSPFRVSLSMASVISVSPLLADSVLADGSSVLLIFIFSPLSESESAPVPLALPVPNSVSLIPVLGSIPESLPVCETGLGNYMIVNFIDWNT